MWAKTKQWQRTCHHRRTCFFAAVRAYAIRPYTCSVEIDDLLGYGLVFVPFPPTSGRMRYAPTLVRLISGVYWVVCVGLIFAHLRAYAIRPYTCSVEIEAILGYVLIPFPPTSGRMRYASTPVRLDTMIYWDIVGSVFAHMVAIRLALGFAHVRQCS